ncbi:hypothetical protein QTP70_025091, partial [Hemibagrus guttatus]
VLSSSVVCQSVCECIMDIRVPQSSPKLNLTLQSYEQEQMLEARFFQLVPLQNSFLKVEVSSTSAVLNWTDWTSEQTQHVCVDGQCWTLSSSSHHAWYQGYNLEHATQLPKSRKPRCPVGWIASGWNCFQVRQDVRTWPEAQRVCESIGPGVHLASVKTDTDFLSVSGKLQSHNHLLLLWTSLNDRGEEGRLCWADGSAYNLSVAVISSLSANQTDCFALQRNATGPGYFFTSLLCDVQLPYLCHTPLVQGSFSGLCLDNVQETEAVFSWSDIFQHHSAFGSVLSLQVHDRSGRILTHTPFEDTLNRKHVNGLSAGHTYYASLNFTHPNGASQTLGPVFIVKTRPNPPQNFTVTDVTSSQIALSWAAPDSTHDASFERYFLCWLDVASGSGRGIWLNRGNLSTVIAGQKGYHLYQITLVSVTAEGVESTEATPLVVITAVNPPHSISVSATGTENVTVCWEQPHDDEAYVFHIQLQPHTLSHERSKEFWVNNSDCITVTNLVPGETYDVGVAAERGGNRSLEKTLQQTQKPQMVRDAVPYAVDKDAVVLFVQMPTRGVYDGLAVTYSRVSTWIPMSSGIGTSKVVVENLSPGTEYEFQLFVTSRGVSSDGFTLLPVRTCLAPPGRVRAGVVTDHSVDVLWDRAQGHELTYEVLCMGCTDKVMVQKVSETMAVFDGVIAGRLCNISVRTEKEFFRDSAPVFLSIRALPSSVTLAPVRRTSSSLSVSWKEGPGVCNAFILSIKNSTYNLQMKLSLSDERWYNFERLPPGTVYTVEVISVSGERHSFPTALSLNTFPAPPDAVTFIEQEGNAMYITWTRPLGRVTGYRLFYARMDSSLRHQVIVHGNHVRITDLIPGSDYTFEIQSFLGEDFSQSVSKNISTSPAGVCSLSLSHFNSSSVTLAWDVAVGHFDFHRVMVSNDSHRWEYSVSADAQEYMVSGLRDGCSYDASVERVRNTQSGTAATLTVHTVPAIPEDVYVVSVSPRSFSLYWVPSSGCDQRYSLHLTPDHGNVTMIITPDGHLQANVSSVTPGTQYTVTVSAVASSGMRSAVSRSITTTESVPAAPFKPEGERVGSNGILLSWKMPPPPDFSIHSFVIRYKEMCPHPDPIFTEVTKSLDIPETLLNTLSPGATYNIKVAAVNKAGVGPFSQSLYFKTAEAPPGMVTNLTAFAQNHSSVIVKWFLPVRINGLITKFAVKAKHARNGQVVRTLELNAEEIMNGALPHCNDAADFLSRGTPSPSITSVTSALPPLTMSAIPSASIWNVPITVGMDMLRPYTAYVFEVSAFTSDGEGQIASTMVRMPEAAPEDSPQNLSLWNITSKSLSLTWEPPTIITGRFSYVVQLYGPAGLISENSTSEQSIVYTGLTPYTHYHIIVMAKSAGATGPAAETRILTPSEAPSAVSYLRAKAVDSTSVRLSWGIPNQPNGLITRYRILVLHHEMLVQDITLRALQQNASQNGASAGMLSGVSNDSSQALRRLARSLNMSTATEHITRALISSGLTSLTVTEKPNTDATNSHTAGTSSLTLTSTATPTRPPWLTVVSAHSSSMAVTLDSVTNFPSLISGSDPGPILSSAQPRLSTRVAITGLTLQPRDFTQTSVTSRIEVLPPTEELVDLSSSHISYIVTRLSPFTDYNFSVSAFTTVGEGPATLIAQKTQEQGKGRELADVMERRKVDILCVQETRWKGSKARSIGAGFKLFYYGVDSKRNRVGCELEEKERFWSELDEVMESIPTGERVVIGADFNGHVGEGNTGDEEVMGKFGVKERNLEGQMYRDGQRELHCVFVDLEKAYDRVPREELWYCMRKSGVAEKYVRVVQDMYERSRTVVRCAVGQTEEFKVKVGLHQGSALSPFLFAIVMDQLSEEVRQESPWTMMFADDIVICSESREQVEENLERWRFALERRGMKVSRSKTEYMCVNEREGSGTVRLQGEEVKKVQEFKYLGSTVQSNGECGKEVKKRVQAGWNGWRKVSGVLCDQKISVRIKGKVYRTVVRAAMLYGLETVSLRKRQESELEVAELKMLRFSLGVTRLDRIRNEYIRGTAHVGRLGDKVREARLRWFGHVQRRDMPSSVQDVSYENISSTSIFVSWNLPLNPNGKITHYTVYILNLHSHKARQQVTNTSSIILTDLDKYTQYKVRVAAWTAAGESPVSDEDNISVLTPEDEPDSPPHTLVVLNTTSSTATITWSPPDKPNGIIVFYEVTYSNSTFSYTVNSTAPSVTLHHLEPYTLYNVTARGYTRLGHGNQTSHTLQMLSGEDVPGSPPYGLAYDSISSSEVNVSWSPPLVPNGVILYYSVEYWNTTHTLNITTHTPSVLLFNLRKYARYRLSVQAGTRVGLGNHSSEMLNITTLEDGECKEFFLSVLRMRICNVFQHRYSLSLSRVPSSPPQLLYYRKLSDNQVELSWQRPEEANSEILYYIVRVWNQSSEFVTNVTETSVVVSVDGPGFYNASVSSWTRLGDGGVLIYITFSTSESVPSDPPQDVFYTLLSPRTVRLSWSPPTQPNGIIQYYTIYYSDNITISTQRVPGLLQWAELEGLRAGHEYRVWLSSSTSLGDGGVISDPLNFTTPEDVPSDTVHNLSAQLYGSTAVVISWDPPLEPNGRVFYQLSLQEAGITHPSINRTENQTITKTTTDTVFLFTKLRKYFPYVLRVIPATSAGPALDHTSVLHLRTDDDVPSSAPLLGVSRNLSSTSILVSWYAPVEPNGEIIEYAVVLQGPRGSNSTYTANSQLILTHLTPYTAYNLSISAVNRRGMGPSLMLALHTDEAGPMSPPRNLSIFNHSSDSVWLHWEPSLEPNGVIQHYGFKIVELNTNAVTYQNSTGASTQSELRGFKPHSSYEISVSTYTRAGNGDQYSLPVTFTTRESVSEEVGNLSCSGLNWDSVYMEWKAPENPNGEILLYHVVSADRRDEASPLMLQDKLAYTFSGLHPDTLYLISVAAVNSAGPGIEANCTAQTLPESVPDPPESLSVVNLSSDAVTLSWLRPARVPGHLRGYRVHRQRLALGCEMEDDASCAESEVFLWVNATEKESREVSVTLQPLLKYRRYRVRVVAWTNAGAGRPTEWMHIHTLAGNPDAPPVAVSAVPSISGMKITWDEPAIISGPTSYLVDVIALDGSGRNVTLVRNAGEIRMVVIGNLTAYTYYSVTVTAFTSDVADARQDGMASESVTVRTLEGEPKDPPKNVTLTIISEEVTRVHITFLPPDEPNGNISAYHVYIYRDGHLDFEISSLPVVSNHNKSMTAVIHGLKGGFNYSIQTVISKHEFFLTGKTTAPPMPSEKPVVALNSVGAIMATSQTITIEMPLCFFSDINGPIHKIQVIVSEPSVMYYNNVSNWKSVFLHPTAPYVTDEGFPNPECSEDLSSAEDMLRKNIRGRTYVIGAEEGCFSEEAQILCNGPLKPKTYYVFKFRATNIIGQYTDSKYSDRVRTAAGLFPFILTDDRLLTRDEQIILGVLLSFFLALFLILIIYASVRIHQRQKEGGTYSPREAEIIETKLKLDQLIAMADMELKEEKIQRLLSYRKSLKPISKKAFIQHVEELCANDNAKFHEEFAELPKLLHDLATSDADLPWNRSKNRFTNIKPYNNNRVKLLSEPGIPGSDYINASFVSGYLCPNEFIATQGPLPGTVADFWRMIWETRTKTIVMLTQCFEKGRIRCHQYWPEDNKPVTVFGDIIITKLTEDVHPDWTVRALRVEKHGDYMVVHHFNYTSWPEHGVPESSSTLIQFVKAVRSNRGHDNTTIVVHCSAGVGRTGVFIALDHLIQHIRDHDFVDVYGLVAELRSERMCMVQNLAQYMFLYQSTLDLLTSKGNSQSIWFVNYSALEKMDSLDAMEGDVELEWEETTM